MRGRTGAVTVVQRFGGALNLNVHFHVLVLDGLFVDRDDGTIRFDPAPALGRGALDRLLVTFVARAKRLFARHGIALDDEASTDDTDPHDAELDEPLLARVHGASLAQRVVLGARSGLPVRRLGRYGDVEIEGGGRRPSKRLQARHLGFDLHAGVRVAARDRARLEALCRYVLRPPIAHDRLVRHADGRVALRLKTPYRDGTTHLLFDPVELVEKLAALVPRPHKNLVLYHGVLAGNAALRTCVVRFGRATSDASSGPTSTRKEGGPNASWADLMRHAFGHDVLECPRCGHRLRFLASIGSGPIVRAILRHLGLDTPHESGARAPPSETAAESDYAIDPTFDFGP